MLAFIGAMVVGMLIAFGIFFLLVNVKIDNYEYTNENGNTVIKKVEEE